MSFQSIASTHSHKINERIFMQTLKKTKLLNLLFYITVFLAITAFAVLQPFGDPPDEVNRFKVAQFICKYGTLPTGEEFEVAIGGYGGSYAFQPILPYIIQGWLLRFVSLFTEKKQFLLLCARMINVLFGVIMAVYVRRLSLLLFPSAWSGWLFSILVMFLPQNLFLHSYVNTDSMASMAGAMILYACVRGWQKSWEKRDCILLALGIILCALSYYNAYGLIVTAILLFFFSHIQKDDAGHFYVSWRPLLQKGLLISALVLLGAGWWFVRSYFIHDGDFLGLRARMENAIQTALPQYSPATRVTLAASGVSLRDMLMGMDFFYFLWNSFVARFGPMTLPTLPFLYIWYYRIFGFGWLFSLLPVKDTEKPLCFRLLFHIAMLAGTLIPLMLCIYYSYTSDYQPQGRYIMPMLLPFMYFITLGFDKLAALLTRRLPFTALRPFIRPLMMGGLILFLTTGLFLTLGIVVVPHYLSGINLWNGEWLYL